MKNLLKLLLLVFISLAILESCHSKKELVQNSITVPTYNDSITFEGGDGSSMADAIIIKGAKSSMDGVPAEYYYIRYVERKLGHSYAVKSQALLMKNNKAYDRIDITLKSKKKSYYFDITDFFGKF